MVKDIILMFAINERISFHRFWIVQNGDFFTYDDDDDDNNNKDFEERKYKNNDNNINLSSNLKQFPKNI